MAKVHPVEAFARMAHEFGPGKAREKLRLLEAIGPIARLAPQRLRSLHQALYFLRAYPDNRSVLNAVRSTIPSVFLGCCEIGMNLFPEFRGGEVRFFYAQLMRSLYHLAGVRYVFVTAYGMGEDNPEALKSGAFWFYRKMGFRATDPDVEALARAEEQRRRRNPAYRCSRQTLRRLSHTQAHFDLSGGKCVPTHSPRLALAASRHITDEFAGDRARAQRLGGRRLAKILGARDFASWNAGKKTAMEQLAPVFGMLPGIDRWPRPDRRSVLSAIRARGTNDDMAYARAVAANQRLVRAIRTIS